MAGLSRQSRRKGEKRAVDMSSAAELEPQAPTWCPPPPDECTEDQYDFAPPGANAAEEKIIVRMVTHRDTDDLVEFAVMHMTYDRCQWRYVTMIDSCHNGEVHLHRYGRRTDARVGQPEFVLSVRQTADIQDGYTRAFDLVVDPWVENRGRWHDA